MSSSASYDAAVAFLDGDLGDVMATINAENEDLLVAGSVTVARAPRGSWPRKANPFPVCVEIVPRGESPAKAVGIGVEEVGQVFDLACCVRMKDLSQGKNQLDLVEDMARALVRRYRGVSSLVGLSDMVATAAYHGAYFPRPFFSSPYWGPETIGARFVRSDAVRIELDDEPKSGERIRAVTRVTFNFLESRAENA